MTRNQRILLVLLIVAMLGLAVTFYLVGLERSEKLSGVLGSIYGVVGVIGGIYALVERKPTPIGEQDTIEFPVPARPGRAERRTLYSLVVLLTLALVGAVLVPLLIRHDGGAPDARQPGPQVSSPVPQPGPATSPSTGGGGGGGGGGTQGDPAKRTTAPTVAPTTPPAPPRPTPTPFVTTAATEFTLFDRDGVSFAGGWANQLANGGGGDISYDDGNHQLNYYEAADTDDTSHSGCRAATVHQLAFKLEQVPTGTTFCRAEGVNGNDRRVSYVVIVAKGFDIPQPYVKVRVYFVTAS
ncbi:hypothetical protein [Longispora fulva]|uniref:Uncharacterized protein n=1 Tax=Longispora fulva TaxID=619741 RepID=A0A8J7KKF0_9ACTN|nr:hypothetical protein [Longispora fulva]MBG6141240.1 hypothetical protein [Longispora fulva]